MKKFTLVFGLFLLKSLVFAQKNEVLVFEEYLKTVSENHPTVKQADARISQAFFNVMASRGAFDPVLASSQDLKTLDSKNYYNHQSTELKVLTPFGLGLKTGVEKSNGSFVNPEYTPGTLTYLGVELPVLKGLLIDQQRAQFQVSKQMSLFSEAEKASVVNDLMLDAAVSYWEWAGAYLILENLNENLINAQERAALVKIGFTNGDKSVADTLEAQSQVQSIILAKEEALTFFQSQKITLARFIWSEDQVPYLLAENVVPDTRRFVTLYESENIDDLIKGLATFHPDLRQYTFKLSSLEIDRKLKFQSMLPELKLKANLLSKDFYSFKSSYSPYLTNNYKFGFDFKLPLLLREGRGKVKVADFKISETKLQLQEKTWNIENKVLQYDTEMRGLGRQIEAASQMFQNYNRLLGIEQLKFFQGESSLFVLNSRQNKLLDAQVKLQKLKTKYLQTYYKVLWSAGRLTE